MESYAVWMFLIALWLSIFTIISALAQPTRPPFSRWEFNSPVDIPMCQIDGDTSSGRLVLRAPAEHNGAVAMIISKPTWRIPQQTVVKITINFSEGTNLELVGVGANTDINFELTASNLKPWLHGFTAGSSGTIVFNKGNEPTWKLDLRGTTQVVNAMYQCVIANGFELPAPFADPTTQPFEFGYISSPIDRSLPKAESATPPEIPQVELNPSKSNYNQINKDEFCRETDLGSSRFKELNTRYHNEQNGVRSDSLVEEMHSQFIKTQHAVLKLMQEGNFRINGWSFSVASIESDKNALLKFSPEGSYNIMLDLSIMCESPAVMHVKLPGRPDIADFASKLTIGSIIEVTGQFEKVRSSGEAGDLKVEKSLTEHGAMTNPEYNLLVSDMSLSK